MNKTVYSLSQSHTRKIPVIVSDADHARLMDTCNILLASDMVKVMEDSTTSFLVPSLIKRHHPEFVFYSLQDASVQELEFIHTVRKEHPGVRIVVLSEQNDADLVLRCFRSGVDEFLPFPILEEELKAVFERLQRPALKPSQDKGVGGMVLGFWGSRGGCGTTTLAVNVAHTLSKACKVVLVDFHTAQGDLAMHLDVNPTYSMQDIIESEGRIDETLIENITEKYRDRLHLLLQPLGSEAVSLSESDTEMLLTELKKKYDYVILDLGHDNDAIPMLAPYIDRLALVMNQNLPSVCMAARKIHYWEMQGGERKQLMMLVNAYASTHLVTTKRIASTVGFEKLICIRNDESRVLSAMNQGIPLHDVSRWGKAYRDIVALSRQIATPAFSKESRTAPIAEKASSLPRLNLLKPATG